MVDIEVLVSDVHCLDYGYFLRFLVLLPRLGVSLGFEVVESFRRIGLGGLFGLVALVGLPEIVLFGSSWLRRQVRLSDGLAVSFGRLLVQFLYLLYCLLVVFAEFGVHDACTEAHFLQWIVLLYVERVGSHFWLFFCG